MLLPLNDERGQNRVQWHEILPLNAIFIDFRVDWQRIPGSTIITDRPGEKGQSERASQETSHRLVAVPDGRSYLVR